MWYSLPLDSVPTARVMTPSSSASALVSQALGAGRQAGKARIRTRLSTARPTRLSIPTLEGPCLSHTATTVRRASHSESCRPSTHTPVLVAPPGVDLLEVTVTEYDRMPARHMLGVRARRDDGCRNVVIHDGCFNFCSVVNGNIQKSSQLILMTKNGYRS